MSTKDSIRKIPYNDRTDLEKLQSQWRKISGILKRKKEWSAAVVRAATAAEIAANIAIRKRFAAESQFTPSFIDSLLVWANGLDGKLKRLIIPSEPDKKRQRDLKGLKKQVERLNDKRNAIVHRGAFTERAEAIEMVELARRVVEVLIKPWEPEFELKAIPDGEKHGG